VKATLRGNRQSFDQLDYWIVCEFMHVVKGNEVNDITLNFIVSLNCDNKNVFVTFLLNFHFVRF